MEGAFEHFQRGAELGDGHSAFNLGYMYVRGGHPGAEGQPDYEEARRQVGLLR